MLLADSASPFGTREFLGVVLQDTLIPLSLPLSHRWMKSYHIIYPLLNFTIQPGGWHCDRTLNVAFQLASKTDVYGNTKHSIPRYAVSGTHSRRTLHVAAGPINESH